MYKSNLIKTFFIDKDYQSLINELSVITNRTDLESDYLARAYIEIGEYAKASSLYADMGWLYQFGRCELLCGNYASAKQIWADIKEDTPASLWGKSLLEFINLYVINIPSFFQIRAFLEVDLDALLNAKQFDFCENIVNGAHLLEKNNQESYKFIGRVFLNNNYIDLALLFLQKAKDICYIDPEVHFMLGKCYLHKQDKTNAIKALNVSLEKGFGYFPAKRLLEQIK